MIVGVLCPDIFKFKNIFGWGPSLPFDPYSVKYFEEWDEMNRLMYKQQHEPGVYVIRKNVPDIVYQFRYGEVVSEKALRPQRVFFITESIKSACEHYQRRDE